VSTGPDHGLDRRAATRQLKVRVDRAHDEPLILRERRELQGRLGFRDGLELRDILRFAKRGRRDHRKPNQ